MIKGLEHLAHKERLGDLGLEKRRLGGDLINVYKYLVGTSKEGIATLFSGVSSGRIRGNGHRLKREIPLKYANQLFYCEGDRTLEQIAQRDCEVSLRGDTQNPTRHSPEQPALVDPALSNGVGQDNLHRSLPTSTLQRFCDSVKRASVSFFLSLQFFSSLAHRLSLAPMITVKGS